MKVFEKSKNYKKAKETAIKSKEEIRKIISENFVNLRYQTELTQAGYPEDRDNKEEIKVYYPVLSLPEGFSKEKEIFIREYSNGIKHQYTLVDESGRQIFVKEEGCFLRNIVRKAENGSKILRIFLNSYIISGLISYNFEIEGENYCFERNFGYEEMLEQVLEDKTASYAKSYEYYYEKEEKSYEEYLESLETKKEDIIPLREIINSKVEEQQITPVFTACFEVCQNESYNNASIMLENPQFSVRIADSKIKYSITVKIVTTKNRVSLSKKVFEYEEEKSKAKYQNGCTLHEIFELFK